MAKLRMIPFRRSCLALALHLRTPAASLDRQRVPAVSRWKRFSLKDSMPRDFGEESRNEARPVATRRAG